ncbi:TetR/AcrR family transcriptional regulator [Actinomadura darangshiensis]|uniref:TetR/AcrR family transcriptional regulator n=1 Tax=Actinomadura darangshiensis TaxID=705336 RepID=A0A4R5AYW6_9ACTN|nr:TetR family transcriptional regulator [Actinomadura darangshiensis]TDD78003.1 TetR/AcrR family transcriptional regulator [Actinomadura darangshiensis]
MNKSERSRGRRRGSPDTREAILAVARRRFLADGYGPVTMRSIAAEAGVDAALISYFFGSKKGLFGAVLGLVANPPEVLAGALPGDPATLPERVLHALLTAWDDPERGAPLLFMVRTAVQDPELTRLVRDLLEREIIGRIAEHVGGADARGRASAFGVQLAGLIFARYLFAVEPIASMAPDELIPRLAPGLRAALYRAPHRPRPR